MNERRRERGLVPVSFPALGATSPLSTARGDAVDDGAGGGDNAESVSGEDQVVWELERVVRRGALARVPLDAVAGAAALDRERAAADAASAFGRRFEAATLATATTTVADGGDGASPDSHQTAPLQ